MDSPEHDVIVVGAGNAALCAALSAREHGARVVVLECAPEAEAGGNSRFAGGVMRFAFDGVDDLRKVADLTDEEIAGADCGSYTRAQYFDDLCRLTQYRTDPTLVERLVTRSLDTMIWLRGQGARFVPIYGRQAGKVGGRWKFFGGLPIEASGGGAGLVQSLTAAAHRRGVEILYETRALSLLWDGVRVNGVRVRSGGKLRDLTARAVVLACGGFEANAEWRTRYLGPGWELAKVRGTRFNTGDGLRMALEIGANPFGNWSGCHACGWDRNAPEFGELAIGDQFEKHSYPLGILINADGRRFVDEGADFHSFTYAKYGRAVLEQPGQFAWQVFDAQVFHLRIEDLPGELPGLLEDRAAILRVGEDVEVGALVHEAAAVGVDEDAEGIAVLLELVADGELAELGRVPVPAAGVAARPVAEGVGADLEGHARH